jgi:phosphoribosylanthranilate isomerase
LSVPPYVKICGITRVEDALAAVEAGADAIGLNFYRGSPRFVDLETASGILAEVPSAIHRVGVFVNDEVQTVIDTAMDLELDCIQLHGEETSAYCQQLARPWYKAFRLERDEDLALIADYASDWIMIDAHSDKVRGGTGKVARWDLALQVKERYPALKLILAGGLALDNIERALAWVGPDAVDVASGVEVAPGIKDPKQIAAFIGKVKQWK